ncbi:hypothetical protein BDQ17DRAFT_1257744 [Cyathus striatus]|nr:hypothetical protein BDQ17DRAFT_1257744 [Cyathus striatus]
MWLIDKFSHSAHLLPAYGSNFLPECLHFSLSLDVLHSYFINKYADHHMHSLLHNK